METQPKRPQTAGDSPPEGNGHSGAVPVIWRFRLYVAGDAPHSRLAQENLNILAEKHLAGNYTVEIVDVLKEPLRTLEDKVYVTPTLVRLFPSPVCRIIGNLSDQKQALLALGLEEAHHGRYDR